MDRQRLIDLLNLKPKEVVTKGRVIGSASLGSKDAPPSTEVSRYALELDLFDQSQGGKLLRHNHHLRETKLDPEAVSDFYSLNFLTSPRIVEKCEDERRLEFVTKTLQTPEYLALHRSTELNPIASELATVELSKSYADLKQEDEKREEKKEEQRARGRPVNEAKEQMKAEIACMKAVSSGLKKAEKEVEEYEETMSALGCGSGPTSAKKMDVGKTALLFQKVKDSSMLRSIFDKAGRCRRLAQSQQRRKIKHGMDEFVGVTLGGKIEHLLPQELAMLSLPEMELDAMRRLIESQMMSKEYRGVERVGKGPIIMTVDKSGSMHGAPIEWACAIALSMAYIARHQKRFCVLIGYAGGREGDVLVLPPGKWDEGALLEWLSQPAFGGTDLDIPIDVLPTEYWPDLLKQGLKRGVTDLIIVTDAIVRLLPDMEQRFLKWKEEEKVKCISIILGQKAGDLRRICNETYEIPHLDLSQEAVQKILSI